ncbi:MAG TPA: TonB family protein [Pyrinomonadaceae bacterium]|nr:TonB family protein [Pyrinomonadaceae bacterium]
MFDKLIVSDEQGAEFKGRSRYFMVSTVVVGVLFVTALVFSLYAADIGLGNDSFELSTMLAPVMPTEPEPPREEPDRSTSASQQTETPTRVHNILRPEENPTVVPTDISVTKSPYLSRPPGDFAISIRDSLGSGPPSDSGRGRVGDSNSTGSSIEPSEPVAEKIPDPPPSIRPRAPEPPRSLGVVNGKATHLPIPPYPAAAISLNIKGEVAVQVTIDEYGKVVSAKAVSGHPLLRRDSERAAMNARFSPTTLSKVPVKVTGVIVYNFKR